MESKNRNPGKRARSPHRPSRPMDDALASARAATPSGSIPGGLRPDLDGIKNPAGPARTALLVVLQRLEPLRRALETAEAV
jgi:hypothetical protein